MIYLSIYLSIYLFFYLTTHINQEDIVLNDAYVIYISLSMYWHTHPILIIFIYLLSIYLSINLPIYLSVHQCTSLSLIRKTSKLDTDLFLCLFTYLSYIRSIHLSTYIYRWSGGHCSERGWRCSPSHRRRNDQPSGNNKCSEEQSNLYRSLFSPKNLNVVVFISKNNYFWTQ